MTPHEPTIIRVPLLREVITDGNLLPDFQPVVTIRDGSLLGFEALMRYRGAELFNSPLTLFDYAGRKGSVVDLDAACVAHSLAHGAPLTARHLLFVNLRPELLSSPRRLPQIVKENAERYGVSLSHLVFEITEDSPITDPAAAIDVLRDLRSQGVHFAIDDVGTAQSHLNLMREIEPRFLKISHEFGRDFERDETKVRIVRNILDLAQQFSVEVILEGIETEDTRAMAESLGIQRGQGYLFSRPIALSAAQALGRSQSII